jgi:putative transposase
MANSYTQVYIHFIFVVKYRKAMIHREWKDELLKFMTGIVQNYGHKVLAVNSMPDHVHLFCGMFPDQSFSDLMRIVKSETSKWINDKKLTQEPFHWQNGFAAFSYARSEIKVVGN